MQAGLPLTAVTEPDPDTSPWLYVPGGRAMAGAARRVAGFASGSAARRTAPREQRAGRGLRAGRPAGALL
jgi:hypothetical protein